MMTVCLRSYLRHHLLQRITAQRAGNWLDCYHSNKRACPQPGQQPWTTPCTATASRDAPGLLSCERRD